MINFQPLGDIDVRHFLQLAGRNGPIIVISGVVLGLLVPILADIARPYLATAIFVFTLGSFLKIETTFSKTNLDTLKTNLLIAAWATIGVPLIVFAGVYCFNPGPELRQGLIFWALVPASPACVAFASMLGLSAPMALLTTVLGTAAVPFYLPSLASLMGGYKVDLDPISTSIHLITLIGGAFLASLAVKAFIGRFVRENPEAMTGLAVCAMFLAGLGSMRGMQAHIIADPWLNIQMVALAYLLLFGFEIAGTCLFWRHGRQVALTAGLVSGTRTITLAWVVLGSKVMPLADIFLAASMVAKYTAPGFTKTLVLRAMDRPARENLPATPQAGRNA